MAGFGSGIQKFCHNFLRSTSQRPKSIETKKGSCLFILVASETEEDSDQNTISVLNHLAKYGYQVSKKKAQVSQQRVKYLRFQISQGQWNLL